MALVDTVRTSTEQPLGDGCNPQARKEVDWSRYGQRWHHVCNLYIHENNKAIDSFVKGMSAAEASNCMKTG